MYRQRLTSGKVSSPRPTVHSFKDTKSQGRKRHSDTKLGGDVDVNDEEQPSKEEPSATNGMAPNSSKTGNSVPSGPNKNITDSAKDGPFRSSTVSGSKARLGPKRSNKSKKAPHRKHHIPSDHTKTFFINSQGHFQCHQDPS